MEAGRLLAPVLMLVGTLAFAFYWTVPRLETHRCRQVSGRRVQVVSARPELTAAKVLVIECDSGLQPRNAAGRRVVTAGGLEGERADWRRKFGSLEPGEFAVTRAGALAADYVVFVCPPLESLSAFLASLNDGLRAHSIALPLFLSTPIPALLSELEEIKPSNHFTDLYLYSDDEKALVALSAAL